VAAADSLPWLLMALPAGHFADRFARGPVMVAANTMRAVAMFAAVLLIASHHISLPLLITVVLINAGGRAIYYSSFQALVPGLIDTRDLEQANGILSGTEGGAENLAGPIVGTSLFALGRSIPFVADGVSLVASCFPLGSFRSKAPSEGEKGSSDSVWEGVRLLFADHRLRVLLIMVASLAGLQGMEAGVLVLLATTEWGVREGAYGLFLATGALGFLLGSVAADGIVRRFGGARTLLAAAVMSGFGYLIMASARSWLLAGPSFALVGLAVGAGSVVAISLRQRLTPEDLMGRVGGAWRGIVWGAAPIGALAAGSVATIGGLRMPLVVAGILQCAVAVVLARPLLHSLQDATRGPREPRRVASSPEPEAPLP